MRFSWRYQKQLNSKAYFSEWPQRAVHGFVPSCEIKKSKKNEPVWFNKKAKRTVRAQWRLYNKAKKSGLPEELQKYKKLRRASKKTFRKIKYDSYCRTLFGPLSRGDSKPFFSFYRRQIGSGSSTLAFKNISCLKTAEIFNTFFQSVFFKSSDALKFILGCLRNQWKCHRMVS